MFFSYIDKETGRRTVIRFPAEARNIFFSATSRSAPWHTRPPTHSVSGALSHGIKHPECEVDYSAPFRVEVKNGETIPSNSQYVFMAWVLSHYIITYRNNFTLSLRYYGDGVSNNLYSRSGSNMAPLNLSCG
jgi:hypothetical protein